MRVTKRVQTIEYAIRDVLSYAKQLARTGQQIFYMNIGDPLAYDFDTPHHIKHALIEAVEKGENAYSSSEGLAELREAISNKEKRVNNVEVPAADIVVTSGISEGIQMIMAALIEEGQEILLPGPTYPPYISYAKFFGGIPVTYETTEDNNWQPDIDDLRRKITEKTRAIVIINPNNPCGALYEESTVREMVDLAGENGIPLVSDEIYDQIVYGKEFTSTAHLAKDVPVIGLNGFSKVYLMTGWRLGYIYLHGQNDELEKLKTCIMKEARIRLCTNTPVQKAGITALNGPRDHIKDLVGKT